MKHVLTILSFCFSLFSNGQVSPLEVQQLLSQKAVLDQFHIGNKDVVSQLYALNSYQLFWLRTEDWLWKECLMQKLSSAEDYGLDKADYHLPSDPKTTRDSILYDIRLTDIAFQFLADCRYGNKVPELRSNALTALRDEHELLAKFSEYAGKHNFPRLLQMAEPSSKAYRLAKDLLLRYNCILDEQGFQEVVITSGKTADNPLLARKLSQLGFASSGEASSINASIKEAQKFFDVFPDGQLHPSTLEALNVPLHLRRDQLKNLLNIIRWSGSFVGGKLAIVNIPSADIHVYCADTISLHCRVIVGKAATPTPTLGSRITEIIVYPYWSVPKKIATHELLPAIKRNIGYLEANNFQVLDKQGRIIKPYGINWKALSTSWFPYSIRQGTGCDNSLGLLKFYFPSPFDVYLHDTPNKNLFGLHKRYFSHGCIRVEEPVALARLLLGQSAAQVEELTSQCLKNRSPLTLKLPGSLPLAIVYSSAWYNNDEIHFYDDVYHKEK